MWTTWDVNVNNLRCECEQLEKWMWTTQKVNVNNLREVNVNNLRGKCEQLGMWMWTTWDVNVNNLGGECEQLERWMWTTWEVNVNNLRDECEKGKSAICIHSCHGIIYLSYRICPWGERGQRDRWTCVQTRNQGTGYWTYTLSTTPGNSAKISVQYIYCESLKHNLVIGGRYDCMTFFYTLI